MMPPNVANSEPLVPLEDSLSLVPSVQVPIHSPQDLSMSIGDITAPELAMVTGLGSVRTTALERASILYWLATG